MNDNFPFEHFINFNNNDQLDRNHNQISKAVSEQIGFNLFFDDKKHEVTIEKNSLVNNYEKITKQDADFETEELKSITEEILQMVKNTISPNKYRAYFSSTFTVSSIKEDKIEFTVTTNFIKKMINEHYMGVLRHVLFDLFGSHYDIEIIVIKTNNSSSDFLKNFKDNSFDDQQVQEQQNNNINNPKTPSFNLNTFTPSQSDILDEVNSKVIKHMNDNNSFGQKIDSNKTFENYIIGPSNNMAQAFAISVAKDPGKVYPQLYLYGNSGLGKTHLLHAICNFIIQSKPHLKICVTTANAFMSEMILSIQDKKDAQFRRKYTDLVDILIIDDIHELQNKQRTQNEFFHIFNELQSKGKQLIFTSDKPPKEIEGIEERIKTRLSSALLIEVQQPDLETRIAILRKKALERDIYLDDDVLNLIATCVKSNIRELEGSLIKLGAYSDLMKVDVDLEIAKEQLGLVENTDEKIVTVEAVAKAVANYFKIAIGDLRGKSRVKHITFARHIAMYMTHKMLKRTLEEIGEYYSKRDHTSVIHGIKKVERLHKEDTQLAHKIYEIESSL